ncbi:TM2 domain-containing protein almondex [Sipha flava]|uniref:TM2 domain-containing protein almondex n=1 Tax=Sipha flava TaxID=143950 RepID=A0A2S2QKY2_9HEMI|nr:TM2 domain-containing protein almondex [Sipha flava]
MKLQSYCGIIFFCYFIVIGLASQNDDDHTDSSIYKKKKKPNPSIPLEEDHINMELECTHLQHKPCSSLPYPCISCQKMNDSCIYGNQTIATCNANVHCQGETSFGKNLTCRYCYQTEFWEYKCMKKTCISDASPPSYYKTNCTVNRDVLCLGRRQFLKKLRCNWTGGHRWSTALILSVTLGGFGVDRFYLGHWQEGIGKLFSFGGLGVWTLIDVLLISIRYLGPADGSLYL